MNLQTQKNIAQKNKECKNWEIKYKDLSVTSNISYVFIQEFILYYVLKTNIKLFVEPQLVVYNI